MCGLVVRVSTRAQRGRGVRRRSFRVDAEQRLADAVAAELSLSAAAAQALIAAGAVYVQGRRVQQPEAPVRAGQTVMVVEEEGGRSTTAPAAAPPVVRVLFEDDALLAVDKPAGIAAQPTPGRRGDSLLDWASAHLGFTAGLVHRLDRQTSGVTLFGKSREATAELARQFREGKVNKRYLAVATGRLQPRGVIDLRLSKDPSRVGRHRASATAMGVPALTEYERLFEGDGYALAALYPKTGRTHQLRAHLRALDAPIAGDALYGGAAEVAGLPAPRCLLHAQAIRFAHPQTGAPITLEAPVPEDLATFFRAAGVQPPTGDW